MEQALINGLIWMMTDGFYVAPAVMLAICIGIPVMQIRHRRAK